MVDVRRYLFFKYSRRIELLYSMWLDVRKGTELLASFLKFIISKTLKNNTKFEVFVFLIALSFETVSWNPCIVFPG